MRTICFQTFAMMEFIEIFESPGHSQESRVTKYDLDGSLDDFTWKRSSSTFTTPSFSTSFSVELYLCSSYCFQAI